MKTNIGFRDLPFPVFYTSRKKKGVCTQVLYTRPHFTLQTKYENFMSFYKVKTQWYNVTETRTDWHFMNNFGNSLDDRLKQEEISKEQEIENHQEIIQLEDYNSSVTPSRYLIQFENFLLIGVMHGIASSQIPGTKTAQD